MPIAYHLFLNGWPNSLSTTLYGIDSDKRKDAQKEVDKQFVSILKRHEAKSYDVTISCALMVDGLGKPIIFNVED